MVSSHDLFNYFGAGITSLELFKLESSNFVYTWAIQEVITHMTHLLLVWDPSYKHDRLPLKMCLGSHDVFKVGK